MALIAVQGFRHAEPVAALCKLNTNIPPTDETQLYTYVATSAVYNSLSSAISRSTALLFTGNFS